MVWQQALGAAGTDRFEAVRITPDGGFLAVGTKLIIPGGYANDNEDVWVVRLDADGQVTWQTTLGTPWQQLTPQYAYAVDPTADGGVILAGSDYFGSERYTDFWVVKLAAGGAITWQRTLGRTFFGAGEVARGVRQTPDGQFVVAGTSFATGGAFGDFWLLKLNPSGEVLWQRAYGGAIGETELYALDLAGDGGLLLAGNTHSFRTGGGRDAWVLRLDTDGEIDGDCGIVNTLNYAAGATAYTAAATGYSAAATDVVGTDSLLTTTETAASPAIQCAAAAP